MIFPDLMTPREIYQTFGVNVREYAPLTVSGRIEPIRKRSTVREIVSHVSAATKIPVSDILSERRARPITKARVACYWIARHGTDHGFAVIARELRRGDHTTVVSGIKSAECWREHDAEFKAMTERILEMVRPA